MKLCRYDDDRLGVVREQTLYDVTAALDVLPQVRYPLPRVDPLIAHLAQVREAIERLLPTAKARPLAGTSR